LETIEELTANEFFVSWNNSNPDGGIHFRFSKVGFRMQPINKSVLFLGHETRLNRTGFFSDTPILLLDEPTTNLDGGDRPYHELIKDLQGKTRY
jgi:hypothetical protein